MILETLHAYGSRNEAQTNCFAVQMIPYLGFSLGIGGEAEGLAPRPILTVIRLCRGRVASHNGNGR